MGHQFQMVRAIEKEIERLKAQETPSHVFVMLDNENKVIRAVASTTIKGRINNHIESRLLTINELEALMPRIDRGEIEYHAIIDDLITETVESIIENRGRHNK